MEDPKIVTPNHLDVTKIGLEYIRSAYNRLAIPIEAHIEAYRTRSKGHKDYVEALYYSTAKISGTPWLTTCLELIEF